MAKYYVSGYTPPAGIANGQDVAQMQRTLNNQGANLKIDGIWGPKTEAAYRGGGNVSNYAAQYATGIGAYMQQLQGLLAPAQMQYEPMSTAAIQSQLEAALRPGLDRSIAERQAYTQKSRAELDADAYARGMGRSTYVTDVKSRAMDAEAKDIAMMEGEYAAALAKLLMDAVSKEQERAFQVQQYNAAQQAEANKLAFSVAQNAYGDYMQYVESLQAAQKKAGRSGAKNYARATSPQNCYAYLEMLNPEERGNIYNGATEEGRAIRDELRASLGDAGYYAAQGQYPGK